MFLLQFEGLLWKRMCCLYLYLFQLVLNWVFFKYLLMSSSPRGIPSLTHFKLGFTTIVVIIYDLTHANNIIKWNLNINGFNEVRELNIEGFYVLGCVVVCCIWLGWTEHQWRWLPRVCSYSAQSGLTKPLHFHQFFDLCDAKQGSVCQVLWKEKQRKATAEAERCLQYWIASQLTFWPLNHSFEEFLQHLAAKHVVSNFFYCQIIIS